MPNVDDLNIELEADSSQAEGSLDNIISKLDTLSGKIENINLTKIQGLGKSLGEISTAIDTLTIKKSLSGVEKAAQNAAKSIQKEIVNAFNITDKKAIANIGDAVQKAVDANTKRITDGTDFSTQLYTNIIDATRKGIDSVKEYDDEMQRFYETVKAVSHIKISPDIAKGLGDDYKHMDGLLRQKMSTTTGTELDSLMQEWRDQFKGIFEGHISEMFDLDNVEDQFKALNYILAQAREGISASKTIPDNAAIDVSMDAYDKYIKEVEDAHKRLQEGTNEPAGFDIDMFTKIADTASKISTKGVDNLDRLAVSLPKFVNEINGTGEIKFDTEKLREVIRSVNTLNGENASLTTGSLAPFTEELSKLIRVLAGAPEVSQNTIELTNALAGLASNGGKVGTAVSSLQKALGGTAESIDDVKKKLDEKFADFTPKIDFTQSYSAIEKLSTKYKKQMVDAENEVSRIMASTNSGNQTVALERAVVKLNEAKNGLKEIQKYLDDIEKAKAERVIPVTGIISHGGEDQEDLQESVDKADVEKVVPIKPILDKQETERQAEEAAQEVKSEFDKVLEGIKPIPILDDKFQAEKTIDELKAKVEAITTKIEKLNAIGVNPDSQRIKELRYELQQAVVTLDAYEDKVEELRKTGQLDTNIDKIDDKFSGLNVRVSSLKEKLSNIGIFVKTDSLTTAESELEELREKYNAVADYINTKAQTVDYYGTTQNYQEQMSKLDSLKQKIDEVIAKKNDLNKSGGFKFNFKGILSGLKSIVSKSAQTAKGFLGISSAGNKLSKSISRVSKMFQLMLIRMALRGVINDVKEGFQNLVQYSSEANASASLLMNSMTQLKNSFAAAAAPLINAFAPALNAIIQGAIKATNAINQLLSSLTGNTTWTKATQLSDDYAASLSNASNTAKKSIMGFDELNTLTDDSSSGSSSTTSATDMFTTENVESNISSFAEKIKEAWKNADFTEIGGIVGEKIKNALDSATEKVTTEIQPLADKIAKSAATLFNGFNETEGIGDSIGRNLGEIINTVGTFTNTFLKEFHFDSLGSMITEGLQSAFNAVDFSLLSGTIEGLVTGAIDLLSGAIQGINWQSLFVDLWNAIVEFVKGIDVGDLVSSLFGLLGSALGALAGAVVGLGNLVGELASGLWNLITEGINNAYEFFSGKIEEAGGNIIEGIFNGILDAFAGIGNWINENIFQPFITGFKKAFGIASPSKVMKEQGGYIIEGLLSGITEKIKKIKETFNEIKDTIVDKAKEAKESFVEKFQEMFSSASEKASSIKETISTKFSNVASTVSDKVSSVKSSISNGFSSASSNVSTKMASIKSTISDALSNASSTTGTKMSSIKNSMSTNIATASSTISPKMASIKSTISDNLASASSTVGSKMESIRSSFSTKMESARSSVSSAISGIKNLFNFSWSLPDIKVPHFTITGSFSLKPLSVPKIGVSYYASGGFPEEGPFFMNQGEIAGKFSNGKGVVANNEQITEGIKRAVVEGMMQVYQATSSATSSDSTPYVEVTVKASDETLYKRVAKGKESYDRRYHVAAEI